MASRPPDLDEYRQQVEEALASETGPGEERFDPLFSAEAVAGLRAMAEAPGADRGLRALARFAAEGNLRRASATEMAEVARRLAQPLVEGPGGPLAMSEVDAALAAEPDAGRRAELQAARLRAVEGHLGGLLADARARREEAAREAGSPSPETFLAAAAGIDLERAGDAGSALLAGTDDVAARALDREARAALGVGLADATAADLPRLVRAPHLEHELPPHDAGPAAARTAELLGFDPRAVPAAPASGLGGLALRLETQRAAGGALAAATVSSRLPVDARRLADPALARAAALLMEGLAAEPAWLARVVGMSDGEAAARAAAAIRLAAVRAAAARALALAGRTAGDDPMSRALGLSWPDELRLADGLAGLGPADDLRGAALAATLRRHLRDEFGVRWFAEPRAGALLRELWLEGGRLDPEALARELGGPGLEPGLVIAEAVESGG